MSYYLRSTNVGCQVNAAAMEMSGWGGPNSGPSGSQQNYNNLLRVDQSNRRISRSEVQSRDTVLPDSTKKQNDFVEFSYTVVAQRPIGNDGLLEKRQIDFVHKT